MAALTGDLVEWGVASRTLAGQEASGDRHLVRTRAGGVLIAVVDGLGHGGPAAAAAMLAIEALAEHASEPVLRLIARCHERLRGTRGAALSLAALDGREGVMTWTGVGNVEGILWRADPHAVPRRDYLVLRGGFVGNQMPHPLASMVSLSAGDVLVLATDGVRGDLGRRIDGSDPAQQIADRILAEHATGNDDALVLVARYLGDGA